MGVLKYLFWSAVYLCRPRPKDLLLWGKMAERTRPPWWKFKPTAWHNDDGKMWEIHLANERCRFCSETITINVGRSVETGKITALNLYDKALRAKPEED